MKYILILLTFLVSCQDYNSNSGDRGRYGTVQLNETDANFAPAYTIIQNRCVNCHNHYHDHWADLKSNADWVAEGVVVPGDPAGSDLIRRCINTGATDSDMPQGGSPLPDEEYAKLREWVTGIQ